MIQRNVDINKSNSILFDKMVEIDNRQGDLNQRKMKQKFKLCSSRQSTNRNRGLSIDVENMVAYKLNNQKISERIQSAKSSYNKDQ